MEGERERRGVERKKEGEREREREKTMEGERGLEMGWNNNHRQSDFPLCVCSRSMALFRHAIGFVGVIKSDKLIKEWAFIYVL